MTPTEKLYEVDLDSGYTVITRPLSPLARRALAIQSEALFPNPDPRQYDTPVSNPLTPGQVAPGEQSKTYLSARMTAMRKQKNWMDVAVIESGVVIGCQNGSNEETVAAFAEQIEALRQRLGDAVPKDAWLATVLYGLITTRNDVSLILASADDTLKEDEIRAAMRSFRRERGRPL